MGKRSRERMTGRTEKQRVKKPNKFKHDDSAKKDLKQRNKEVHLFRYFNRLIKEGRIGKNKKAIITRDGIVVSDRSS